MAERKTMMEEYIGFSDLEELADYIGFAFPHEIHSVAAAEGFYAKDCVGDYYLSKAALNDYLARYGANIRVESVHAYGLNCEIV